MIFCLVELKIGDLVFKTSSLSSTARYISQIAAIKYRVGGSDATVSRLLRRLITVAINGGVAVDLLESCQLQVDSVQLKPDHFSRMVLHLNKNEIGEEELLECLDLPIGNLKYYLKPYSNEASFCGLFWNIVLNNLFRFRESKDSPPNHRIEQEWATSVLYQEESETVRKVDLVALIDLGVKSLVSEGNNKKIKLAQERLIPMLTVEASRFPFSKDGMHKDFGKTLGMISANCITLAHRLVELGKKPEEAVVYGLLIGGLDVRLCTAHAVVTELNGSFEIHANITFHDHWHMNVIKPSEGSCNLPCCASTDELGFESLKPATMFVDLSHVSISGSTSVTIPEDNVAPTSQEGIPSYFMNSPLNMVLFKRLKTFVDCIKARIDFLKSTSAEIMDNSRRKFMDPNGVFYFSQASPTDQEGKNNTTPQKGKPTEQFSMGQRTRMNVSHFQTKSSHFELEIYSQCSAYFPLNFPRIYDVTKLDDGKIRYEFERLTQFRNFIYNFLNREHSLIPFLKFSIDSLFGLHVLHERIGVIHCDISPANVMFSEVDSVFKLIDFDLSIKKENVSVICRPGVGTKGFIAPESESSGVYTEASDIYSLGTVIFSEFIPIIDQIDIEENVSNQYIRIIAGMIQPDPKMRLSVLETIRELISLLNELDSNIDLGTAVSSAKLLLLTIDERIVAAKEEKDTEFESLQLKIRHPSKEEKEKEVAVHPLIESHSHEMQL